MQRNVEPSDIFLQTFSSVIRNFTSVEFGLAPQHETSCDPETTTKEDFDYLK